MAMLDRYRKPGGFYQLLALLETCGLQKQAKFLEIIRTEDPRWADALRAKMLDIERIFAWNDETLAEIIGTLQDLTLAVVLQAASPTMKEKISRPLTHGRRRKIDDLVGSSKPTPSEVATMHMKVIETVRKMAHDGFLRFEKFDAALAIEDGIEEVLSKSSLNAAAMAAAGAAPSATGSATPTTSLFKIEYEGEAPHHDEEPTQTREAKPEVLEGATLPLELANLKKKVADLSKENSVLRHELSITKNKLEQIRKIA